MRDRFYSVADDGSTMVKEWDFITNSVKSWDGGKVTTHPWLSEENGVGYYVEQMEQEEFDAIGKKWVWLNAPLNWNSANPSRPLYKHYIKWL